MTNQRSRKIYQVSLINLGDEVNDLFLESVEESRISEQLAGVCGLQNVNWVKNNEGGFSHEQITELKLQLKQTFQLIVQNFVIDKVLNHDLRPKSGNPDFWHNQLVYIINRPILGCCEPMVSASLGTCRYSISQVQSKFLIY